MRIFLIRHGESIQNTGENKNLKMADPRVYLTENGKKQALRSAEFLKQYISDNYIDLSTARIWYSPYDRTVQTMNVFNKVNNFDTKHNIDFFEDIRLTEQQFGLFDSIPKSEWKEKYPNEYECYNTLCSQKGKFYARLPMGESPFDTAIRVKQFFGTIKRDFDKHNIDTLFIFTHGTTLRVFTMQYCHKTVEWYENEHNPGNCWIRLINNKDDKGYIYKN